MKYISSLLRKTIEVNEAISKAFDRLFPVSMTRDGNREFKEQFVWKYLVPGQTIYDIGGGKQPFLGIEMKKKFACTVVGIDISGEELLRAPAGAYDRIEVADIGSFRGRNDADVVICQALLEHVQDVRAALNSVFSILKPGGVLLLFVPCRNAPFARLNLLLPEAVKRWLLFKVFPSTSRAQGFRSYYNRCTPGAFFSMAQATNFNVIELKQYYMSSYFSFFFPFYLIWRMWTALVVTIQARNLCETFSMALQSPELRPH